MLRTGRRGDLGLSALLAARVDTDLLRRAFGVVLLYIGVKETFLRKNNTFLTKCEEGVQFV